MGAGNAVLPETARGAPDLGAPLAGLAARVHNCGQLLRTLSQIETAFDTLELSTKDLDPSQYGEADRREVNPPIQVERATWTPGGQLDWWIKERRPRLEWFGRVRGKDGKQRWIKASDIRPAEGESKTPGADSGHQGF